MPLSPALQPFQAYKNFIHWRLENGVKLPINPVTNEVCNAHDRSIHTTYEHAELMRSIWTGNGLAFVFTDDCGFFFLDLDKCLEPSGWSPLAHRIARMLPGAAFEVSQSGKGLHVFGRGNIPEHSCKNAKLGLEFYHTRRFVALTDMGTTGNAASDQTLYLPALINEFFPATPTAITDLEHWQDQPCDGWSGPQSDDELIEIMLTAKSSPAAALFGKASPRDLWTCNKQVLMQSYPDPNPERGWDYSQADAALAGHLSFYTGKNSERIKRLMFMSGLRREKWEKHQSYLWRTISYAIGKTEKVYSNKKYQKANQFPSIGDIQTAGLQLLLPTQQAEHFKGCCYVRDIHRCFTPDGGLLKSEQFNVVYGGYSFSLDNTNEKTTRKAWDCFTESQAMRFPKAETTCFRPEYPSGLVIEEEGRRLVKGDAQPFLDLVKRLLPNESDRIILLSYMAALVQHPGKKFQWCPILQGTEGNGKTVMIRSLAYSVGHRYTHLPNAQDLGGNGQKFNSWIKNNLFIGIEEVTLADRQDILDALKPLITNKRIEIQGKGADQVTGDNRANFLMACNEKEAVSVGVDKRRYAIFYTAQQRGIDLIRDGMDGAYFPRLYNWLEEDGYAIINYYLHEYQIRDELNPAKLCHRAPSTTSTMEMLKLSETPIEQEINEAIGEGRPGFAGGWVNSLALDQLLRDSGRARFLPHTKRRALLKTMGYDWHPNLPDGRVHNPIPGEVGKAKLFIKEGHIACNLTKCADIVERYLADQVAVSGTLHIQQHLKNGSGH